ncbi:MAG: class A beta-lactamase-related serine hydrolase [Candidatus Aminicenantes bacterium]|nr:class A beta-lactamase-related serine hydrolase [Candidatus Aminicenantes bacterium]
MTKIKAEFILTFLMICLFFSLSALSFPSQQEELSKIKRQISEIIASSGAEVGFSWHDLESGTLLEINERTVMHAASLMKVPVMIEVFRRIDRGELKLDDMILVQNSFTSIADGSPFSLSPEDDSDPEFYSFIGQRRPLKELIERMITVSSNLATNILIDLVKAERVMKSLQEFGIKNLKVLRGVEDSKAYERGLNNTTDARDMRIVLETIVDGRAASPSSCATMIQILQAQKFRSGIPAGLPPEVKVGNKTGNITRIAHDAAIVFPQGRKPYVLVILTRGFEKEAEAEKLMASLSRLIYERLN